MNIFPAKTAGSTLSLAAFSTQQCDPGHRKACGRPVATRVQAAALKGFEKYQISTSGQISVPSFEHSVTLAEDLQ
jgi:hypothetical protein